MTPFLPAIFDLTLDHVPDLIHMMQDDGLHWADSDSDEVWALGQLRAGPRPHYANCGRESCTAPT